MRIGLGFDAHELEEGKPLKLGGLALDYPKGLRGHSDGDAVLHSLSDAILGACAAGDIGVFFPDSSESTKGIDSAKILDLCLGKAVENALRISNIDLVIIADQPKLSSNYDRIRESIATLCKIPAARVSVKAKTTEGTLVSRTSLACIAVVLMEEL